jgi:hypothetical protein
MAASRINPDEHNWIEWVRRLESGEPVELKIRQDCGTYILRHIRILQNGSHVRVQIEDWLVSEAA